MEQTATTRRMVAAGESGPLRVLCGQANGFVTGPPFGMPALEVTKLAVDCYSEFAVHMNILRVLSSDTLHGRC
jgi:hypothetical protein